MKIVAISDTHGLHQSICLPEGDLLIHAGDLSKRGLKTEVEDFLNWFSAQPHRYKVFIAGNHDFFFEKEDTDVIQKLIPDNIIYLNDSAAMIEGLKIWGSPIQPLFYDWAFNRQRGADIKKHWDLIPADADILLTHGPAHGILDLTMDYRNVGCEELLKKIEAVKPKYHICGHIHEAHGVLEKEGTTFINASLLNVHYRPVFKPFVFDF
jgi:Icc-related predicted phosphoesterase